MHLFQIVSVEPLEPHGDLKYGCVAANGDSLLFCDGTKPWTARHDCALQCQGAVETARAYTGLCYDTADHCYWGCSTKCSQVIYRLSQTLREVNRLPLPDYAVSHGPVRSISYDRQDDCLILTFPERIVRVCKHSGRELGQIHCGFAQCHHCCVHAGGYHYAAGRQCGTEALFISLDGGLLVQCCLPVGHRVLGMAETTASCGTVINLLSVKHRVYHYLLKGILVDSAHCASDCGMAETCPGEECDSGQGSQEGNSSQPTGGSGGHDVTVHDPEEENCGACGAACQCEACRGNAGGSSEESTCYICRGSGGCSAACACGSDDCKPAVREKDSCHAVSECPAGQVRVDCHIHLHGEGGSTGPCRAYGTHHSIHREAYRHGCPVPWTCGAAGGCASIIESIALEQTAISHILNAEGEKIQRVVAVSDRPADFLDVNRSVLETVTRLTHLEQVLFTKLELACGALRSEHHGRHSEYAPHCGAPPRGNCDSSVG